MEQLIIVSHVAKKINQFSCDLMLDTNLYGFGKGFHCIMDVLLCRTVAEVECSEIILANVYDVQSS